MYIIISIIIFLYIISILYNSIWLSIAHNSGGRFDHKSFDIIDLLSIILPILNIYLFILMLKYSPK